MSFLVMRGKKCSDATIDAVLLNIGNFRLHCQVERRGKKHESAESCNLIICARFGELELILSTL